MKKIGRPCKITPELTASIVEFIQQGCDQKTACNLAGVPYSCYNEWKAKGSEGKEPYATFLSVTSQARNGHKHRLIKLIMAGAGGLLPRPADWRAAAWLLEKGWPLEYGDRLAVEADPSPMPMTLVLSTNGKERKTTFKEAQEILCSGFPIRDKYEPPGELAPITTDGGLVEDDDDDGLGGNGNGAPRFHR
jgi:hypothetical protein